MDGSVTDHQIEELCRVGPGPGVWDRSSPTKAILYSKGKVSIVSGRSGALMQRDLTPFGQLHLNTQYALLLTKALATFHAKSTVESRHKAENGNAVSCASENMYRNLLTTSENTRDAVAVSNIDLELGFEADKKDSWTAEVSKAELVAANISILSSCFEMHNLSMRTVEHLHSINRDLSALTQFLKFAAFVQNNSSVESVGPILMCDVWVPVEETEDDVIAIRMRGGENLHCPQLRDTVWSWLTLVSPNVMRERHMELCDVYCSAFNSTVLSLEATNDVEELSLFDIMRDLGENFLHGFLTLVHKFVASGTWAIDRQVYTSEGLQAICDTIGFLIDNGIVSPIFIM